MQVFEEVGRRIHEQWCRYDFDQASFPDIASEVLARHLPSNQVGLSDVVEHVLGTLDLGPQHDLPFGEPPVTVFQVERFYIEVLPWIDASTAVHQHGFVGAFHVLEGSSIHSEFSFTPQRRFSERLMQGQLDVRRIELLVRGDVRPIRANAEFVHSLFHLDRPSVSVVVRTRDLAETTPQYAYSRATGLAWDPFYLPQMLEKQLGILKMLAKVEDPRFDERAQTFLARADAFATFRTVLMLSEVLPIGRVAAIVRNTKTTRPDLLELMLHEARERGREQKLIEARSRIREPEHRFFLALLLNTQNREHLFSLVKARESQADPRATVMRWMRDLTRRKEDGAPAQDGLGIRLDAGALSVLELMLAGHEEPSLLSALRERHGEEQITQQEPQVRELVRVLKGSSVLRPLLRPAAL